MGASSFSPSPMTTRPSIVTLPSTMRMASTAAPSAPSLSPRPTQRLAASAAASVVRTSSMARLRSGAWRSDVMGPDVTLAGVTARDDWQAAYDASPKRDVEPATISGVPGEPVYGPDDGSGEYPGQYPYTRGPYASMYRSKLWTMRMFAGFGTAEDTNA